MLNFILLTLLSVFLSDLIVRIFFSKPKNESRSGALSSQRRRNQPQTTQEDAAALSSVNTWANDTCVTGNQTTTQSVCTNSHTDTTIASTCDTSPMSCD
jgi:hypothetical protein